MKSRLLLPMLLAVLPLAAEINPLTVLERGPNHRVWSMSQAQTNGPGELEFSGSGRYT